MSRLKLKMRLIKFIIFLVSINSLNAQDVCNLDQQINQFILEEDEYHYVSSKIDASKIYLDDRYKYIGFIGNNKKRIFVTFEEIKKSGSKEIYTVKGETYVFQGVTREFEGELILENHYSFDEILDNGTGNSPSNNLVRNGFSIFKFILSENKNLSSTGTFEGYSFIRWNEDKNGIFHYDETTDFDPSYINCAFVGTWKSYKTGNTSRISLGHHRLLCSDDLDWGASEFSPNPKYDKYGWADYKP